MLLACSQGKSLLEKLWALLPHVTGLFFVRIVLIIQKRDLLFPLLVLDVAPEAVSIEKYLLNAADLLIDRLVELLFLVISGGSWQEGRDLIASRLSKSVLVPKAELLIGTMTKSWLIEKVWQLVTDRRRVAASTPTILLILIKVLRPKHTVLPPGMILMLESEGLTLQCFQRDLVLCSAHI